MTRPGFENGSHPMEAESPRLTKMETKGKRSRGKVAKDMIV